MHFRSPHRDCSNLRGHQYKRNKTQILLTLLETAVPSSQAWATPGERHCRLGSNGASQCYVTSSYQKTCLGKRPKGFSQGTQSSVQPSWNRGQKPNTFLYIYKIPKIIIAFSKVPNWKEIINIEKNKTLGKHLQQKFKMPSVLLVSISAWRELSGSWWSLQQSASLTDKNPLGQDPTQAWFPEGQSVPQCDSVFTKAARSSVSPVPSSGLLTHYTHMHIHRHRNYTHHLK